ncbi:hypothetical protein HZA56_19985 [Candidatus Poribacteria bacterium]|nr:hypothetical protein [Candidatus Poribacteria bacterium]
MYEKGNTVKVAVNVGDSGLKELAFVGRIVIDATDFMAIQFDTIIIPKMEIKSADLLPDKPLEEVLGTSISKNDAVHRPKPPIVENVRFLSQEPEAKGGK